MFKMKEPHTLSDASAAYLYCENLKTALRVQLNAVKMQVRHSHDRGLVSRKMYVLKREFHLIDKYLIKHRIFTFVRTKRTFDFIVFDEISEFTEDVFNKFKSIEQ